MISWKTLAFCVIALAWTSPNCADSQTFPKKAGEAAGELLRSLHPPSDKLTLADSSTVEVEPHPQLIETRPTFAGDLELQVLGPKKNADSKLKIASKQITACLPFEHRALAMVKAWLKKSGLSSLEKSEAAEEA